MMYIDPADKAIALNLDEIGAFLDTVKGKSVPAVMFCMFSRCTPNNHAYISAKEIAEHTGFSLLTISRAINKLCASSILAKCSDRDFLINPDVAFIGKQSNAKRAEFSLASRNINAAG